MSRKLINVQTLFLIYLVYITSINEYFILTNLRYLAPPCATVSYYFAVTLFYDDHFFLCLIYLERSSVLGRNRSGHAFVIFFLHHRIFSSFFGSYSFYSLGKWFECLLGHFIGKWTIVMKLLNTHSVCCKVISKSKRSFVFLDFWNVSNWKL